jgi:hypothetical protein
MDAEAIFQSQKTAKRLLIGSKGTRHDVLSPNTIPFDELFKSTSFAGGTRRVECVCGFDFDGVEREAPMTLAWPSTNRRD